MMLSDRRLSLGSKEDPKSSSSGLNHEVHYMIWTFNMKLSDVISGFLQTIENLKRWKILDCERRDSGADKNRLLAMANLYLGVKSLFPTLPPP